MLAFEVDLVRVENPKEVATRCVTVFVDGKRVGHADLPWDTVKIGGLNFEGGESVRIDLEDSAPTGEVVRSLSTHFGVDLDFDFSVAPGMTVHLVRLTAGAPAAIEGLEAFGRSGQVSVVKFSDRHKPAPQVEELPAKWAGEEVEQ